MAGTTYSYTDPGLSTSTTLANDLAPLWLQEELLAVAEKLTVFQDMGDTPNMPEGEGKTYSAQRYERLPLPGSPITEGVTPDSTALVVNKVTAVLEQWGMVTTLSDVALMTTKHPALQAAKDRLGNASAELQDREIQRVLQAGGVVVLPNNRASRTALVAGDVPGTDFVSSHQYAETTALMNAEVGRWRGVRWKRSNLLPIQSLLPATGAGVTAAALTSLPTGDTGFTAGSTVKAVAALADPTSGLSSQQTA